MIRVKTLRGDEVSWDQVNWHKLRPVALATPVQNDQAPPERKVDLNKRVAGYSEWATQDTHQGGLPEKPVSQPIQHSPTGYWVDVQAATPDEVKALRAVFPLHPLAFEDAEEEGHWSRFETYPAHDFITYRTLSRAGECDDFSQRVSIFVFPGSVVSYSRSGTVYLDTVWGLLGRESVNTPSEVAYELVDHGTDTFGVYADALEARIESVEEEVVRNAGQDVTTTVFEFKHNLAGVRRLAAEAREAVLLLARHGHAENGDLIRYRDALSNLDRAVSRLDAQREALTNLLDTSLGFQSQRMNQVMRTLTVVSTFFLPLTFLAGVWGMNFKVIPELSWHYGYAMAWGSFILTAAGMAYYFKRRGWW
ncbi:magnesium transporter CorA family protein [Deinococcus sp.]|uniref:magnesium transporter CorA family protein n=1 Tax=Deinococcus sp. TaxID=47478 RepID=UPI0025EDAAB5|nr:magnesium transporter CorA family protein [Deinococcus sp.]